MIITSLESEFGWSGTEISFAISLSILTFGLGGPLGGTLIDRFGPRLLGLIAVALALRISKSAVTRMPTVAFEAARP